MLLHAQHHVAFAFVIGDVSHHQIAALVKLTEHALLRVDVFTKLPGHHLAHRAFGVAAQHNPVVAAGDVFAQRRAGAAGGQRRAGNGEQQNHNSIREGFHQRYPRVKP